MSRFIDVVTAVATTRKIESYEAALTVEVTSSRRTPCIEASLKLRDRVIEALKTAGFSHAEINEGGVDARQNHWSSNQYANHRILVRNDNMLTLTKGMAAVEQALNQGKPTFFRALFASLKQSFHFGAPVPIYAPSVSAAEAIESAMQRARTTADAIAIAHGEVVESVAHVYELAAKSQSSVQGHDEYMNDDQDTFERIDDGSSSYSTLDQPVGRGTRRFRVRFLLKARA